MAISYSNTFNVLTQGASTISFTVAENQDRLLVVSLGTFKGPVSAITYAGIALTKIAHSEATGGGCRAEMWYLIAPPVGTANVVISVSSGVWVMSTTTSYYGANQIAQPHISTSDTGTTNTITASVETTTADTLLVDSITTIAVPTKGAAQTLRGYKAGQNQFSYQHEGSSDKQQASAGTGTMTWALSSAAEWETVVAAFSPAPTHVAKTFTAKAKIVNNTKKFTAKARIKKTANQRTFTARAWILNKATVGSLSNLEVRSVDVMKYSKDNTTNQLSDAAIDNVTRFCQENFNLTHIGVACNIDPVEWFPVAYTPAPRTLVNLHIKWASSVHNRGLKILHRLEMFSIQNKSSDWNGFVGRVGGNRYPAGKYLEIFPTTYSDLFDRNTIEQNPGTLTSGTPVTDSFGRSNTSQSSNNIGTDYTAFGAAGGGWNIESSQLRLYQPGNEFTYNIARTNVTYGNAEYLGVVQKRSGAAKSGIIFCGASTGTYPYFQGYVVYLTGANTVAIADLAFDSSSRTPIVTDTSLTLTTGEFYKIKVQLLNGTIKIKVWVSSASEPASWLISLINTKYASGFFGFTAEGFETAAILYDELSITPLTITGLVTDWVVNGSWSVVSEQLKCLNGTSDSGNQVYSTAAYKNGVLQAKVKSLPGTGRTGLVFRYAISGAAPGFTSYAVRIKDNNSLILEDSGTSTLATTSKVITADTWYRIKVDFQGTAIKAKTWVDGASEPGSWDIDTTDSKYATGSIGFFPSNASTAFYDTVTITPTADYNSLLGIVYKYLTTNPSIFQTGDILAPFPEKTAGTASASGVGDGGSWLPGPDYAANYAQFFNDLKAVADTVFASQGKTITTGHSSNNFSEIASGWILPSLFNTAGIIATDYYLNTDQLQDGVYASGTIAYDGNLSVVGSGTTFLAQLKPKYFIHDSSGLRAEVATVVDNTHVTLRTQFFSDPSDTFVIAPTFSSAPFSGHTWQIKIGFGQDAVYSSLNTAYNRKAANGGAKKIHYQEWGTVPTMINSSFTATVSPSIPERGFALNLTSAGYYREAEVSRPFYRALAQLLNEDKLYAFNYWGFWNTGDNDTGLLSGDPNTFSSMKLRREGHVLAEYYNAGASPIKSFKVKAFIKKGAGRLSGLTYRGIDLMKLTKDNTASQPVDTVIENYTAAANRLMKNLTHIALVLPIDPVAWFPVGYTPAPRTHSQYYQKWADEVHKQGLRVLHRATFFVLDADTNFLLKIGVNRYPLGVVADVITGTDRNSFLGVMYDFIVNNPGLFMNGDIWAPFPERTENKIQEYSLTSLSRAGNTVTATTAPANHNIHGSTQVVKVFGADQPEYNGSFIVNIVNSNTFTYTINSTPATPATGGFKIDHGYNCFDDALSPFPSTSPGVTVNFANFFNNLKTVADAAFTKINKTVITGYTSNNYTEVRSGFIPQSLFTANQIVSIDYYQNYLGNFDFRGAQAKTDADIIYAAKQNIPIFWQEWGTTPDMISKVTAHDSVNHFGDVSGVNNPNRAIWIRDFYNNCISLLKEQGKLIGFNYWGFWDTGDNDSGLLKLLGTPSVLSNFTLRAEGQILAQFYDDNQPKAKFTAKAKIRINGVDSFRSKAKIKHPGENSMSMKARIGPWKVLDDNGVDSIWTVLRTSDPSEKAL